MRDPPRSIALTCADKATITELLFMQVAARTYLATKKTSLLKQAQTLLDWLSRSGLLLPDGTLYDGLEALQCSQITTLQWTYSYGGAWRR